MRRPILLGMLGILALGAVGGGFYAGRLTAPKPQPPKQAKQQGSPPGQVTLSPQAQGNIGLRTVAVVRRRIDPRLTATGIVAADQLRSVQLRALGGGRVLSVAVQPGDRVHRGQVLMTYDDLALARLRMQQSAAQAALGQAKVAAQSAEDAYARGRALAGQTVAAAEVERRRAAAAQARAQVATEQATISDLGKQVSQYGTKATQPGGGTAVVAPFDGFVLTSAAASGDVLQAGQIVVQVADLSTVWVLVQVYQNDVQKVLLGGTAMIRVTGLPGQLFEGHVSSIGHALDPRTGAVQVRCDVANPNQILRIGMFATADLPTSEGRDALVVPAAAVQRISDQPVVFVRQAADKFMRHGVQLGVQTKDFDEIRQGIHVNDAVVTTGSFQLKAQALQSELGAGS